MAVSLPHAAWMLAAYVCLCGAGVTAISIVFLLICLFIEIFLAKLTQSQFVTRRR